MDKRTIKISPFFFFHFLVRPRILRVLNVVGSLRCWFPDFRQFSCVIIRLSKGKSGKHLLESEISCQTGIILRLIHSTIYRSPIRLTTFVFFVFSEFLLLIYTDCCRFRRRLTPKATVKVILEEANMTWRRFYRLPRISWANFVDASKMTTGENYRPTRPPLCLLCVSFFLP